MSNDRHRRLRKENKIQGFGLRCLRSALTTGSGKNKRVLQKAGTSRDRVVTSFRKRIAAQDTPRSQKASLPGTIFLDRLNGILRTGRNESAVAPPFQRRQKYLISANGRDQKFLNNSSYHKNHSTIDRPVRNRFADHAAAADEEMLFLFPDMKVWPQFCGPRQRNRSLF